MTDQTQTTAEVANPSQLALLGVFVTAKLKGKEDCRQGFLKATNPLIIFGVTGREYECEGDVAIVGNPPFNPRLFKLAEKNNWKMPSESDVFPPEQWNSYWQQLENLESNPYSGRPIVPHRTGR